MVKTALWVVAGLLVCGPGCSCSNTVTRGDLDGGGDGAGDGTTAELVITPNPADLEVVAGGPPTTQVFTATAHLRGSDQDVSAAATWSIDDGNLGAMAGATFTSVVTRGGSTVVRAAYTPPGGATLNAEAVLNLRFRANVVVGCTGCPAFPIDTTPACTDPAATPTLVYPPDGVLLPPNMNVIEVHFLPGAGNDLFEIAFQNTSTDVRVETQCSAVTSTRNFPTGGCAYLLDQTVWDYLVLTNRGGDPINVSVRAAPQDGSCASRSDQRAIQFAELDLNGGIYYWQSVVQGGVAGKTGGIFRHDFGVPAAAGEPFVTPGTSNKCVGCHALSRDGLRMTFGTDDADSDDEYADLHRVLMNVATKTVIGPNEPAGFASFAPDHTSVLSTDGTGTTNPPILHRYDGDTGAALANVTFAAQTGKRITHPDWSKDGATVYFVIPGTMITWGSHKDDTHFSGGGIYSMTYDAVSDTFGAPTPIIESAGANENNYYPGISPDGQFLIFNRAVGTDMKGHDAYNNAGARLWALYLQGGTPVDMARANQGDGLTNSWPRWSPFIQTYKGKSLLWVTFSSTRDYGLRVQNENVPAAQGGPLENCYPPDTPENPNGSHTDPLSAKCNQPQIWMAAISLSDIEMASGDPSFPAFWLPFQDVTAHNHNAQWTEVVVGPPQSDGGTCGLQGDECSTSQPCCDGYECDTTGHCQWLIP